jgi:hypothetical protein
VPTQNVKLPKNVYVVTKNDYVVNKNVYVVTKNVYVVTKNVYVVTMYSGLPPLQLLVSHIQSIPTFS